MIGFTPFSGSQIIIGGQTGFGAFPKYSIQKDVSFVNSEGGVLNSKYSITISGKFVVPSDVDITDVGKRQSKYNTMIAERVNYLKTSRGVTGKLEISPYGGKPGKIIYNDARLISVNIPESPDESSGILFSDYSITFEAYIDASIGDGSNIPAFDYSGYLLSSVEESWSIDKEDLFAYEGNNPTQIPFKNYMITHTVSATGIRKANSSGTAHASTAWKEAERWVKSRLKDAPFDPVDKELLDESKQIENVFNGRFFSDQADSKLQSYNDYNNYNHIRIPNINISEGSYSVTETWSISKSAASIDIEINADIDLNDLVTMTISGTIVGYDSSKPNALNIKKIENAETAYGVIKSNAYNLANLEYAKLETGKALPNIVRSSSLGKNKPTGTITFNFTYNDTEVLLEGSKNNNVSISYDNDTFEMEIIAIIPIIAKSNGPIIQRMKTSKERRRSGQLDAIMDNKHRANRPNGYEVLQKYAPQGSNVTIQNFVENWEPLTGNYNLNVEWVY